VIFAFTPQVAVLSMLDVSFQLESFIGYEMIVGWINCIISYCIMTSDVLLFINSLRTVLVSLPQAVWKEPCE